MDGHIVGSMISANSITGEQIQANSIKTANLELSVQKKIQDATNEETVKALIKADLDGFESTLSKEFVTVENAATQIQQATEVAVKEATQNIIDNAVSESMGAVDGQLNDKLNQYTSGTLLPAIAEKAEEVLQNAEDYVVTQLESYATKQELSSSISQTREQIELSVSEKYTTKTESATIITEAIDGITVGAINRVLGTGENKSFKFNGGANETWLPYKFSNDISDKEVFVSFKYTLTGTAQNGSQIEFAPSYLKKTNNQTVYRPKHVFFTSDRLQDVNITDTVSFTTKDFQDISPSSTSYIRFVGNGFTGTLSISEVQIKPGNSKTTWSPAPEDTITDITNAKNEAISSANSTLIATIANYYTKSETNSQINVAKNEINQSVSSTYATKSDVNSSINGVNSSISNLQTRMNTAESKITDNAITNVVKQNFYTKTETENAITSKDYATQSQVQQTANDITYKFTQSGGYNLVRNGNPKPNNYRHWWISGNANWYLNSTDIGIQTASTNEAYAGTATFKVQPGTTYSVSCWLMAEINTKGTDVYFIGSANDDGAYTEIHHLYTGSGDQTWRQAKKTFTVGSNINYGFIRIDNNGRKDTSTGNYTVVFFSEVQMVKGSDCYPQWSPNPNEVYDGITTIDKDGITVTHSNANTKSTMSADGFKVIRNSDNKNLFNATNGNLTMEGTLSTGTSGKYIKVSDSNYKVYDGSTQKAFFGLASNDVWTNVPKLYMGIRGVGESSGYDYFSLNAYDANSNPQSYPTAYVDMAYYNVNRKDYSNIKMYGDGIIRISPITDLIITSNTDNGSYGGTGENVIARFSTSVSSNYNGHLDIGAITNHDKNANGLVLEHNRNGVWCAARVNVDSNNEKFFRPMANSADMKCGSSGFKWHSVWASNGSVQTSDERHKMKMGVLDNEECYQMVKNTDIYKYCMLPKSKDDMSEDEIKKMAKKASKEEIAIQTGIMAQDILGYDCAKYVLTHDSWLDEENNEEKEMYNINPYGFTSVIMGALKEEISKREALERRMETLEEKLNQLISLQKQQTQE